MLEHLGLASDTGFQGPELYLSSSAIASEIELISDYLSGTVLARKTLRTALVLVQ